LQIISGKSKNFSNHLDSMCLTYRSTSYVSSRRHSDEWWLIMVPFAYYLAHHLFEHNTIIKLHPIQTHCASRENKTPLRYMWLAGLLTCESYMCGLIGLLVDLAKVGFRDATHRRDQIGRLVVGLPLVVHQCKFINFKSAR
jgi:hypothetical protein